MHTRETTHNERRQQRGLEKKKNVAASRDYGAGATVRTYEAEILWPVAIVKMSDSQINAEKKASGSTTNLRTQRANFALTFHSATIAQHCIQAEQHSKLCGSAHSTIGRNVYKIDGYGHCAYPRIFVICKRLCACTTGRRLHRLMSFHFGRTFYKERNVN